MSEYSKSEQEQQDVVEIDLLVVARDFIHGIKRLWWLVLILIALGAGAMYFHTTVIYTPNFTADATVSVRAVNSSAYYDDSAATAEQLGKVFPYILTSGVLQDIVAEDLGMTSMPGSITVTNIEGTNLLTISVSAGDGGTAYNILQSFIQNYPSVAQYVVGQTELTVIDDSGIPADSGKRSVIRGSVRNGALAGAIIGFIIILIYMITFRTVRTVSDLRSMVNAPYLGSLPIYRRKQRRNSDYAGVNILERNPQKDYVEAINLISTRLERKMQTEDDKVLMVTSAIPGEGKSTVAGNLAASFAKKGKRVFLVDCDLRHPTTQQVFHVDGEFPGLKDVLTGKINLKGATYRMPKTDNNLYCVFGAPHGARDIEILGSERMETFLNHLKERADVIILDTPPTAMLVDTSILMKFTKNVLFVVQSDYARRRFIQRGIEELYDLGANVKGVVLNGDRENHSYSNTRK